MTITLALTSPLKSVLLYQQLRRREGFTAESITWYEDTICPWEIVQVEAFSEDDNYILAVFPPSREIDFALFKEMVGLPHIYRILDHEYERLETIEENLPIYTDIALQQEKRLNICTGPNRFMSVPYKVLKNLVNPVEGVFSLPLL